MRKNFLTYFSAIGISLAVLYSCGNKDDLTPTNPGEVKPTADVRYDASTEKIALNHEFRAAWLTTVMGLDWPNAKDNAETQKSALVSMIRNLHSLGCNAIVFQINSNQDAMYKSDILPWSYFITGEEDKDPGYDPLALAIKTARELDMEIHGWLNPLRVSKVGKKYSVKSVAIQHPDWIQTYSTTVYMDPGRPEVRERLYDVAYEVMSKYDLDGLHIDDYFYPSGLKSKNDKWDDSALYKKYGGGKSLADWRYSNINACVKALSDATHKAKPGAVFGVSPAGRLALTDALYADPRQWVSAGTIDYLAPQIYWTIERADFAAFDTVLESWKPIVKDVPMFIGLAAYKHEAAVGKDSHFADLSEFSRQLALCRDSKEVLGHIWFRPKFMLKSDFVMYFSKYYPYPSLTPKLGKTSGTVPAAPAVGAEGRTLTWNAVEGAEGYAVYVLHGHKNKLWQAGLVYKGKELTFRAYPNKNYFVIAYKGKEKSENSNVVYTAVE